MEAGNIFRETSHDLRLFGMGCGFSSREGDLRAPVVMLLGTVGGGGGGL